MESEPANPFTPPSAELYEESTEKQYQPHAGKWLRLANLAIDWVTTMALSWGFFALILKIHPDSDFGLAEEILAGVLLGTVYHFLNEVMGGRGISKWITGTRAEMADGSPLKVRSALTRSLCRNIPFEALSFLGYGPGGWHDTLTNTRVVNVRARPVSRHNRQYGLPRSGAFTPPGVHRPSAAKGKPGSPPKQVL